MVLKDWPAAERVFIDFQKRFPKHALASTLAPKLALIYQETQQWDKAAAALAVMAKNDADPEARRQSLYLSAELYQKSGRLGDAADRYAEYVKAYPKPFALATEARYQLLQLAEKQGDDKTRRYWLNQLIDADAKAGGDRNDRSRYLAAYASSQFAGEAFARFERIKLTLPIKKSLAAKKGALDETLKAYKKVLDYGVAEFVTEANYRIGNVYSQLSRDLMNSERPKGLDDLALEQYEILLEEQAYPFEEKSVELLAATAERSWEGLYDKWVKQSFTELAKILPARYGKQEQRSEVSDGLY
jgi:tetratricopeptide (TPR) repeat protein